VVFIIYVHAIHIRKSLAFRCMAVSVLKLFASSVMIIYDWLFIAYSWLYNFIAKLTLLNLLENEKIKT